MEQFNINAVVDWVSDDITLAMNLAIAAGDLPDIFQVNAAQFEQLLEAGLIEDITDVVDQWLSPKLKEIYEREMPIFETAMRDGRIYGLPVLFSGHTTQQPILWVRKDWYLEAGNPEIKTIADLEDLMETFKVNNGAEYGTVLYNAMSGLWRSAPMWHVHPRHAGGGKFTWLADDDGRIYSGYEQPEMLDFLAHWRDWYERGIVKPDFATNDWNTMIAAIINGETGIIFGQNWLHWQILATIEANGLDSYFLALPYPTVDGEPAMHTVWFENIGYHVVRKGYAHPEILPILNSDYVYIMHEASITESIDADLLVRFTDAHWIANPVRVTVPHWDDTLDTLGFMNAHIAGEEFDVTSGWAITFIEETMRWYEDGDVTGLGRWSQMGTEYSSLVLGIRTQERGQFLYDAAWGPDPQEVLDLRSMADGIIQEGVTKIIMGVEPLEYWFTVLEDWKQAGGDRMTEAVNRVYGGE